MAGEVIEWRHYDVCRVMEASGGWHVYFDDGNRVAFLEKKRLQHAPQIGDKVSMQGIYGPGKSLVLYKFVLGERLCWDTRSM